MPLGSPVRNPRVVSACWICMTRGASISTTIRRLETIGLPCPVEPPAVPAGRCERGEPHSITSIRSTSARTSVVPSGGGGSSMGEGLTGRGVVEFFFAGETFLVEVTFLLARRWSVGLAAVVRRGGLSAGGGGFEARMRSTETGGDVSTGVDSPMSPFFPFRAGGASCIARFRRRVPPSTLASWRSFESPMTTRVSGRSKDKLSGTSKKRRKALVPLLLCLRALRVEDPKAYLYSCFRGCLTKQSAAGRPPFGDKPAGRPAVPSLSDPLSDETGSHWPRVAD